MATFSEMKNKIEAEEYLEPKFWNTKVDELNGRSLNELNRVGNEKEKLDVLEYYNELRFNAYCGSACDWEFSAKNSLDYIKTLLQQSTDCRNIVFISDNVLDADKGFILKLYADEYYRFSVTHDFRTYTAFISRRESVNYQTVDIYTDEEIEQIEKFVGKLEGKSDFPLDDLVNNRTTPESNDMTYFWVKNIGKF